MCLNCTGELYDIELKEKLGEGGQGAVYKAVLKSNGKLIAVKKMNAACLDTEEKEVNINFFNTGILLLGFSAFYFEGNKT